jgi:small-conductance mechanosensitive channel
MRNTNVEPRIFTHIEPYGLKISAWYLTNSYATMTLRSTISIEIIERIQEEEKIHLAFPTQSIYVDKNVPSPEPELEQTDITKRL